MTERLCKDCRWAKNHATGFARAYVYDWTCLHPSSVPSPGPPNLVTGELEKPRQFLCYDARQIEFDPRNNHTYCGAEGRFWEAIEAGFGV